MIKTEFRCNCPISTALDVVGDKWSIIIIKQMLIEGKKTFKDFIESDEAIATNILSSRLKMLEEFNIITKGKLPENKKTNIYTLTDKGLDLTPVIVELSLWSDKHMRDFHPELYSGDAIDVIRQDKTTYIKNTIGKYRAEHSKV
ncbi:winged helix-turn-helix transcriptional regulator [Psychroserpens damuponensis]|uniref:winged helix-turn-helix transcriptional regulator n=1 Tax=Psychroserpens damuponensis TaxID=943936 RepID=UPI00058E6701|nr:helix-turn-helix domain-containing protein [Psychroserpens damuponensis]